MIFGRYEAGKMRGALQTIKQAEVLIENAVWQALENEDHSAELESYEEAQRMLQTLADLSADVQREHDRVMAYCLMRINDARTRLDKKSDEELLKESLRLAERSGDEVQTARSSLSMGIHLLNSGQLPEAESHLRRVFDLAEGMEDNRDMQQVVGWTLIVRANILLGKSLYEQARHVAEDAIGTLQSIENYAGLRVAYRLLASAQRSSGQDEKAQESLKMADRYEEMAKKQHQ
jgi:tetratricopeptide (TPR) repeat protein